MSTPLHPSTKDDILRYLLQKGQATAQELADDLGISPQAIRRHLKDLESETLILHQSVSSGMGRPQHVYRLSRAGRSHFPDAYDRFALDLLNTLSETVPPEELETLLRKQWQRKGVDYRQQLQNLPLRQQVERLVQLRRSEGYMTDWCEASQEEGIGGLGGGDVFIVKEYNCTIANVAESFPSLCDYELELFNAALENCRVERTHWMMDGEHRCGYLITPLEPQS